MSYNPNLSPQYLSIRNTYDANFHAPSQASYNVLRSAIYEFKVTHYLPDPMYHSVNSMQNSFGSQLKRPGQNLW